MTEHIIKLPDVGEGIAEAELVEWHVKVGDIVREDDPLAAVMTDKATVEIPSPVEGKVTWVGAEVGDTVPIGTTLVKLEVGTRKSGAAVDASSADEPVEDAPAEKPATCPTAPHKAKQPAASASLAKQIPKPTLMPALVRAGSAHHVPSGKPLASPAVRLKAREAGIDLRQVSGGGPAGRITHEDIDAFVLCGQQPVHGPRLIQNSTVTEVKVMGLRRRIAEKMALSKSRIPHITIVEEINVSPLEDLRATLNKKPTPERPRLTLLPFLMRTIIKALAEQPALNALYDDEAGVIHQHAAINIGIATQTSSGLVVPVIKHAEARDLWGCGLELTRLSERARDGTATRDELTGSTITITSLGKLGGIATTPIINHPEVAIVGVNNIVVRPIWDGTNFVPRKIMNLSSSFDHRVIDGWDAALFVQRLKDLLENPTMLFVDI